MNVSCQKWSKIPLGEIFKTTSGGTPLSSCKEYYDGGTIPWINSGELNTPFINAAEHFITPIGLKSSSAKMLPVDSVLIAMYGATAGRASLLKIPACVNQAICAVLPSKNYSPLFLKYYLDTIYQYLVDLSSGSARSNLSQEVLQKVKIPAPDLPTQLRIAAILGSIDEKIELNRKKIVELKALAKTIYDYWFVQFDFPDKNGTPYKSSGGKMVWNEQLKREIPEGWEVKSIGSIETNIVTGKTPNTDDATNFGNDIPFLTIDDLRGHVYTFTSQRSLSEKGAKLQSSKFIPPNSLCVSCIGTIGEISFSAKCSQTNQQINSIVFDDDNYREYIYFYLKQYFRSAIVKTGNTFANMNKGEFARILCLVPSKKTLACFHAIAQSVFEQLRNMEHQIMLQIEARELLLPLLMNGQVKVKE